MKLKSYLQSKEFFFVKGLHHSAVPISNLYYEVPHEREGV